MNTNQWPILVLMFTLTLRLLSPHHLVEAMPLPDNSSETTSVQQPSRRNANSNAAEDSLLKLLRERKDQLQTMESELKISAEELQAKEQQLLSIDAKLARLKKEAFGLAAILLLAFAALIIAIIKKKKKSPDTGS